MSIKMHTSAHINADTEVEVTQPNYAYGAHILTIGSDAYNSPSHGVVTLFLEDDATVRRLRDALDAHLTATGGAS